MTAHVGPQEPATVAIVYDKNGNEYDQCWTWETGQTYALQGWKVVAVAIDGSVSVADAQALYDAELECFRDCFGRQWSFDQDES